MPKLRDSRLQLVAAVLLTAVLAGVLAFGGGGPGSTPERAAPAASDAHGGDSAHQAPSFTRTVAVHTDDEPAPSAHPRRMRALLTKGKLPSRAVEAKVLTDENCAPDAAGVSHCRNRLRLPGGRKLTVRHPHRMHDVPCMTPGEIVRLGPAARL